MKKNYILLLLATVFVLSNGCKKDSSTTPNIINNFVGNWAGAQQIVGASIPYKFSLAINSDNTVINIDSAFSNQVFPGTYTFTADSIKIIYDNGTKWNLKLTSNTTCSGSVLGFAGAVGTVSMTKK